MHRFHKFVTTTALALGLLAGCGGGTPPVALAAPTELKAMELQGGAHLTWKDNSTNEAEFMIERKMIGEAFQAIKTVPFNSTQYHDTTVTSGMSYAYRVMAMDGNGQLSSATNEVTFKAP